MKANYGSRVCIQALEGKGLVEYTVVLQRWGVPLTYVSGKERHSSRKCMSKHHKIQG